MLSTYKKGWALAATAYLTFSTTHFKLNFNVVKRLLFVIASPIKMYSLKNLIRIWKYNSMAEINCVKIFFLRLGNCIGKLKQLTPLNSRIAQSFSITFCMKPQTETANYSERVLQFSYRPMYIFQQSRHYSDRVEFFLFSIRSSMLNYSSFSAKFMFTVAWIDRKVCMGSYWPSYRVEVSNTS